MQYQGQNVYTFLGTKGTASFPELKVHSFVPSNPSSECGCWTDIIKTEASPAVDSVLPFTRQLRHFVDVCQGTAEPNCSALEALKTIILLEAVKESISTGKPVDVIQG